MANKVTVTLIDRRMKSTFNDFKVKKVTGTTELTVTDCLKKADVDRLISRGWVVNLVEK
jgi:hypothetical protein